MAETSSLNCLSCRSPYQHLHSLNAWTPFSEKALLFTDFCFVASPSQTSGPKVHDLHTSFQVLFRPVIHFKNRHAHFDPRHSTNGLVSQKIAIAEKRLRFQIAKHKIASFAAKCCRKIARTSQKNVFLRRGMKIAVFTRF